MIPKQRKQMLSIMMGRQTEEKEAAIQQLATPAVRRERVDY